MAGGYSSNSVGHTNEVTLRQAQLVQRWVTIFGGQDTLVSNQPPRQTQPPTISRMENEYWPKCGDAQRLRSKGRKAGWHIPFADKRGWQEQRYDPSLTRAIPEHLREDMYRYKSPHKSPVYFTLILLLMQFSRMHTLPDFSTDFTSNARTINNSQVF